MMMMLKIDDDLFGHNSQEADVSLGGRMEKPIITRWSKPPLGLFH